MVAIENPQMTSMEPMILLYHLAGTFMSNIAVSGNTLAYFTYSFLWKWENSSSD